MTYNEDVKMNWVTSDLDFINAESAQACLDDLHQNVCLEIFAHLTEDGKKIRSTYFTEECALIIAKYVKSDFQITCLFTDKTHKVVGGWVNCYNTNGNCTAAIELDTAFGLLPKKEELVLSISANHPCLDVYDYAEIKERFQNGLDDGSLTIQDIENELEDDFSIRNPERHIHILNEYDYHDYYMLLKA